MSTKKDIIFWVRPEETSTLVEIDWDCTCIPSFFKEPPCREAFAASYTCFARSKSQPKGKECVALFEKMNDCLAAHPELFDKMKEQQQKQ